MKKKILIIGGSSGMGLATAKMAAEKDYQVVIASRSGKKLNQALKKIDNENVIAMPVDTHHEISIKKLFETIGNIDHLVIPGSEVQFGNIKNSTIDEVKKSFDSKFFGPLRVLQIALNYINSDGSIILFSGTAGTKPENGTEILSAINAAVESFGRALAISLAPIRVNIIAPGIIDTPVYDDIDEDTKKLFKQFTDSLIIKRMGEAKEVAQAALYLIENNYVTGTTLYVDGGHVIS